MYVCILIILIIILILVLVTIGYSVNNSCNNTDNFTTVPTVSCQAGSYFTEPYSCPATFTCNANGLPVSNAPSPTPCIPPPGVTEQWISCSGVEPPHKQYSCPTQLACDTATTSTPRCVTPKQSNT